ncbi:MAG: transposase [Gammaproteobacteria bacterium]|nr:transposase [Gammaproteobacteria bacterium]
MKYAFIKQHHHAYPVRLLCRTLDVSNSGYYEWLHRLESPRSQETRNLLEKIETIHHASHETYGYPRIHAELRQHGYSYSRESRGQTELTPL